MQLLCPATESTQCIHQPNPHVHTYECVTCIYVTEQLFFHFYPEEDSKKPPQTLLEIEMCLSGGLVGIRNVLITIIVISKPREKMKCKWFVEHIIRKAWASKTAPVIAGHWLVPLKIWHHAKFSHTQIKPQHKLLWKSLIRKVYHCSFWKFIFWVISLLSTHLASCTDPHSAGTTIKCAGWLQDQGSDTHEKIRPEHQYRFDYIRVEAGKVCPDVTGSCDVTYQFGYSWQRDTSTVT